MRCSLFTAFALLVLATCALAVARAPDTFKVRFGTSISGGASFDVEVLEAARLLFPHIYTHFANNTCLPPANLANPFCLM